MLTQNIKNVVSEFLDCNVEEISFFDDSRVHWYSFLNDICFYDNGIKGRTITAQEGYGESVRRFNKNEFNRICIQRINKDGELVFIDAYIDRIEFSITNKPVVMYISDNMDNIKKAEIAVIRKYYGV